MHIVLAGFGNMGRALAEGWLDARFEDLALTVVDPDPGALAFAEGRGLGAVSAPDSIHGAIDVAVLAVKPDQIESVLERMPDASLYLSIAAGRTLAELGAAVGGDAAIVRAMPNTPAAIGFGVTGLCGNAVLTPKGRTLATELMSAVGLVEWLDDEGDMDALTAVSGSGPAYVFLMIECLTEAGVDAGLEPEVAARIATATVRGAGAYAASTALDPASLRRRVTSPNGTTAAALAVLRDDDALKKLIGDAVRAAVVRSRELGGQSSG